MNFSNKELRNMRSTNVIPTEDGGEACVYHRTAVVKRRPDGCYVLNSGGFDTVTTRRRINQFTPRGCTVYQKDFLWYIDTQEGKPVGFFDGIVLDPRGYPVNGTGRE